MIKINLLGVSAPPPRAATHTPVSRVRQAVVFIGSLVFCFALVGVLDWSWGGQINRLNVELGKQRAEQTRFAAIKVENLKYEQARRLLELHINTIQALQTSRVGPTEFMNALANVVNKTTSDLFLFSVNPQGDRLMMRGEAASANSVANLLSALKASGHFDDVQLRQFYEDDLETGLRYKFNLDCTYKSPAAGVSGAPAGATTSSRQPGT
jgi:Tfp pilus assembly protein PilN